MLLKPRATAKDPLPAYSPTMHRMLVFRDPKNKITLFLRAILAPFWANIYKSETNGLLSLFWSFNPRTSVNGQKMALKLCQGQHIFFFLEKLLNFFKPIMQFWLSLIFRTSHLRDVPSAENDPYQIGFFGFMVESFFLQSSSYGSRPQKLSNEINTTLLPPPPPPPPPPVFSPT